jgi:hypothetical protein
MPDQFYHYSTYHFIYSSGFVTVELKVTGAFEQAIEK